MPSTTYGRNKLIDSVTSVTPFVWPTLYLSLHTADPTIAGLHTFEVTAGGYARLSLAGIMGAASAGISVDTSLITIGPALADWGTIIFLGIEDSSTIGAGNMLFTGTPSIPRTITSGQSFQIPTSQLLLSAR